MVYIIVFAYVYLELQYVFDYYLYLRDMIVGAARFHALKASLDRNII